MIPIGKPLGKNVIYGRTIDNPLRCFTIWLSTACPILCRRNSDRKRVFNVRLQVDVLGVFSPEIARPEWAFNCEIFLFVDTNQVFGVVNPGDS